METRNCQNCKKDFLIEEEDFSFYSRMQVPPPTFCPDCRLQRRLASLNHRSLYKRNCSKCSKSMFSMYRPDSPFVVYCTECYFSDDWDAMDYGQDYDFSRPFFEQFYDLLKKVPQIHVEHQNNNGEGVVFSNYVYRSARVYLSYGIVRSEDIFYSWGGQNGNRMCMDCTSFRDNENCYDLVDSNNNFNSVTLTRSHQCIDSQYLFDCMNCTSCFMSSNLRNKSYVFRNQQYTPEVYKQKVFEYLQGKKKLSELLYAEYLKLIQDAIHRFATILQSENSTGDYIFNSKNVRNVFSVSDSENLKYGVFTTNHLVDVYDFSMSGRSDSSYEFSVAGRGNTHCYFSYNIGDTQDIHYCDSSNHIKDCFGCAGIKHKEYCIFNKQYTKEEYEVLVKKIIQQMQEKPFVDDQGITYSYGEYFPVNFSRFAYNETAAFEFFQLKEDGVTKKGLTWVVGSKRDHSPTSSLETLPEEIALVPESITQEILPCAHESNCNQICTHSFKITQEELAFYKRFKISLPTLCPNCRYFERQTKRTLPWKLWKRKCMCDLDSHDHCDNCPNEFETSYSPEKPERVYCGSCYQKEVI